MEEMDQEIVSMFLDEAEQHLQFLNEGLVELEGQISTENINRELVDSIFRSFHSVKGAAGMLGFSRINRLTHQAETLLDLVRENKVQLNSQIIQVLLESLDALNILIEELNTGSEGYDVDAIIASLENIISNPSQSQNEVSESQIENSSSSTGFDSNKYLSAFLDDTNEAVRNIEAALLSIDESINKGAQADQELVNEIFRYAHQIKGGSATMGFEQLTGLSHILETLLEKMRSKQLMMQAEHVSVFLEGIDVVKSFLSQISAGQDPKIECQSLMVTLNKMLDGNFDANATDSMSDVLLDVEKSETDFIDNLSLEEKKRINSDLKSERQIYHLKLFISDSDPMPGMRAYMALTKIKELGDIIKAEPNPDILADADRLDFFEFILSTQHLEKNVRATASADQISSIKIEKLSSYQIQESSEVNISKSAPKNVGVQTIRVDIDRLDGLMNMSGELVINKAKFRQLESQVKELLSIKHSQNKLTAIQHSLQHLMLSSDMQEIANNPSILRLNDIVHELDTVNREFKFFKSVKDHISEYQEAIHELELTSSEIQRAVMEIRMVPVGPLFSRFKRVVRDISKSNNKKINLIIRGEETELDKKLIDELLDPLTHMVRNAADHGLESPQDRTQIGKAEDGTLTLDAFHKGNFICIQVQDDGRGLDPNKLKQKALDKGLIGSLEAESMSDREAYQLIFHPGFSTAQKVTDISGRGVGMDIVRKKIEELSGTLEIESKIGSGSTFTIFLPLTLAIQKSLLCKIHDSIYALPLESVLEIVEEKEIYSVHEQSVIKLRNQVIPIHGLQDIFASSFPELENSNAAHMLVILKSGDQFVALRVHALIGEQDIVVKSLTQHFQEVPGLSGASILGNGQIALILDVTTVMDKLKVANVRVE